jgi:hypothetical protein
MKRTVFALSMAVLLHLSSTAQITINSGDMPAVGDTLRFSEATPASAVGKNFAATGANYTWDFSTLLPASQMVDSFVGVLSTPILYYPTFLTKATVAKKGDEFTMGTMSLTNVYDFFKGTTAYYAQVGLAAQLSGVPLPTLYSAPDYLYHFPLNFGNEDSCQFTYEISVPTLFSYNNQSKRYNTVDGWGTLTTPFGTFQTLRVKSILISRDSIHSDSLPFPIPPTTTTTTEYKWLATGHHEPLLTVTNGQVGANTVVYRDVFRNLTAINEPVTIPGQASVSPNPSREMIRVSHPEFTGAGDIWFVLNDPAGKELIRGSAQPEGGAFTLDIARLDPGIYLLRVSVGTRILTLNRVIRI